MQLSYTYRLICLALCSAGLLLLLMESIAWMAAPLLLAQSASANARRAERSLFLLALFARLAPWLVALGAWVPAYVRGEDNLLQERVGWLCITGAICVLAWSLHCCLRALRAWVSAQRCCRVCLQAGTTPTGLPMLIHPSERPLLAVAGLFRPRMIVSRSLLTSGHLSADALDLAFLHEGAHARHYDNLKLAILTLLPHIPFATRSRPSVEQQWRLAAEMAADEDGVNGRPEHSVLLAETLVAMARKSSQLVPRGSLALLSRPEDLRIRVERLLQRRPVDLRGAQTTALHYLSDRAKYALLSGLALLTALCYLGWELGHHAAEVLLHIG